MCVVCGVNATQAASGLSPTDAAAGCWDPTRVCAGFFHAFLQITMDQKRLTSNYPLVRCSMFDFSKNYVGPTLSKTCSPAMARQPTANNQQQTTNLALLCPCLLTVPRNMTSKLYLVNKISLGSACSAAARWWVGYCGLLLIMCTAG